MNSTVLAKTTSVRIALRRRADLVIEEQTMRGVSVWVVKDPLALKYYRFSADEFIIWSLLDGRATDAGIVRELHARLPNCELDAADVRAFAESLYIHGLVLGDTPRQGQRLVAKRQHRKRQRLRQTCMNLLAIRFRGIDLTWLLRVLYPLFGWFFRPTAVYAVIAMAAMSGCIALLNIDSLTTQVVEMHEYFGPGSWLLLACTLAITKILHELGHALACKHCGGECHEIGVMLLVLTPCLYCDVSDSWLLPNKWHRAAIAAAGMYVEVALATLATLVWWLSTPGLLHYLSLQIILICSVSTLLFNGNPLARYDGYYILADLVEVPNLRQQASSALANSLLWLCCGLDRSTENAKARSTWLLAFGVASLVYRWLLLVAILWFLHCFCEELGLEVLWQLIAALTIGTAVMLPLVRAVRFVTTKEVQTQMNRQRLGVTASVLAMGLGLFCFVPLPQRVHCTFETRPLNSKPVHVTQDARLNCLHVLPGQTVLAGEQLAELSSVELEFMIERLSTAEATQAWRVNNLKYERFLNDDALVAIPQAAEILAATGEQLQQRRQDLARLTLRAPTAGVVFAPTRRNRAAEARLLPTWSGTPLDRANQGATLRAGEVVCEIGEPNRWEAVLIIDQADIERVTVNQDVRLLLDAMPLESFHGHIAEIALQKLDVSPASLSIQAGGQLPTHTDQFGNAHPSCASYTARVPFSDLTTPLKIGLRGTASIRVGSSTLASRLWQYLCRTFCLV